MTGITTISNEPAIKKYSYSSAGRKTKAPRMFSIVLSCMVLLLLQFDIADGFAVSFGLGAALFQPKGLVTKSAKGNVPALLEASNFFVDAFWVGKVGGGAKE